MPSTPATALHMRMQRKKKTQCKGVADVRRKLWVALLHAEDVLEQAPEHEPDLRIKAIHAISQVGGQLLKAIEVGELEVRLTRLEEERDARTSSPPAAVGAPPAQRPAAVRAA